MANPMRNEERLYQILKEQNIQVHPIIWQLLDHHIRNDLNGISITVGDVFDRKEPLSDKELDHIIRRIKNITSIIEKIQQATSWDGNYYQIQTD